MTVRDFHERYAELEDIANRYTGTSMEDSARGAQKSLIKEFGGTPPPVIVGLKPAENHVRRV